MRLAAGLLLFFTLGPAPPDQALGQQARRPVLTYKGGLGLSVTAVDDDRARRGGFPDTGFGVQLDFSPRVGDVFAVRAEAGLSFLGLLCFNDEADCADDEAGRPAFVMLSGALAAGLLTPPLPLGAAGAHLAFGVFGGREWLDARRGVDACVNCFDERLGLRGGLFVEPAVECSFFPGLGLGVYYRVYHPRADLRGRLTLRLVAGSS